MTHRKDPYGRGRVVHYESKIRARRLFTTAGLVWTALILALAVPPLTIPFAIVAVVIWLRRRHQRAAARPTYRDEVIARGRKEF